MTDQRFTRPRAVAVFLGALAIASCTFLGSRDIDQCTTDADCVGAKVAALDTPPIAVCVDRLCARPSPDAGPLEEGGKDAIADAPPDTSKKNCVLRAECGKGALCVDNECLPLVDPTGGVCQVLNTSTLPAYLEEGAPIIGIYTFSPLSSLPWVKAADKALQEINLVLPKERQITAVFCNKRERLDFTSAQATIDFLDKRKIPLVLGQFEASELRKIDPLRLAVWSTLGNLSEVQQGGPGAGTPDAGAAPYRFLVDELQSQSSAFNAALGAAASRANTIRGTTLAENIKIAIVRNEQFENTRLAARLEVDVGLLGAGFSERVDVDFITSVFDANTPPNNGLVVAQLRMKQPDVIIALGGDEIAALMRELEAPGGWPLPPSAGARPVWVVSTRAKFSVAAITDLAQGGNGLRARIIGVDFSGHVDNHAAYRAKLSTVLHAGSFDHIYDAVYAFAFTSERAEFKRAAGAPPPSAFDLTAAFDEVFQPPGTPGIAALARPADFMAGVMAIKGGLKISYEGATGPFLFSTDGLGRTRRMGQSYFCFPPKIGSPLPGLPGEVQLSYYVDSAALTNPSLCVHP